MIALALTYTCDTPGCRTRIATPEHHNHRRARRYATRHGWTCIPRVGDWCPRHPHHAPAPRTRGRGRS